jgi:hypothetical protein
VKLHPTLIQEKAAIIVEHFREHTAKELGGRANAMVVTDSRAAAVKYKRAVDHHIREHKYTNIRALVAFSGEIDGETETSLNGFPESQTARRFKGEEPFKPGGLSLIGWCKSCRFPTVLASTRADLVLPFSSCCQSYANALLL